MIIYCEIFGPKKTQYDNFSLTIKNPNPLFRILGSKIVQKLDGFRIRIANPNLNKKYLLTIPIKLKRFHAERKIDRLILYKCLFQNVKMVIKRKQKWDNSNKDKLFIVKVSNFLSGLDGVYSQSTPRLPVFQSNENFIYMKAY